MLQDCKTFTCAKRRAAACFKAAATADLGSIPPDASSSCTRVKAVWHCAAAPSESPVACNTPARHVVASRCACCLAGVSCSLKRRFSDRFTAWAACSRAWIFDLLLATEYHADIRAVRRYALHLGNAKFIPACVACMTCAKLHTLCWCAACDTDTALTGT